eukprot:403360656
MNNCVFYRNKSQNGKISQAANIPQSLKAPQQIDVKKYINNFAERVPKEIKQNLEKGDMLMLEYKLQKQKLKNEAKLKGDDERDVNFADQIRNGNVAIQQAKPKPKVQKTVSILQQIPEQSELDKFNYLLDQDSNEFRSFENNLQFQNSLRLQQQQQQHQKFLLQEEDLFRFNINQTNASTLSKQMGHNQQQTYMDHNSTNMQYQQQDMTVVNPDFNSAIVSRQNLIDLISEIQRLHSKNIEQQLEYDRKKSQYEAEEKQLEEQIKDIDKKKETFVKATQFVFQQLEGMANDITFEVMNKQQK